VRELKDLITEWGILLTVVPLHDIFLKNAMKITQIQTVMKSHDKYATDVQVTTSIFVVQHITNNGAQASHLLRVQSTKLNEN